MASIFFVLHNLLQKISVHCLPSRKIMRKCQVQSLEKFNMNLDNLLPFVVKISE